MERAGLNLDSPMSTQISFQNFTQVPTPKLTQVYFNPKIPPFLQSKNFNPLSSHSDSQSNAPSTKPPLLTYYHKGSLLLDYYKEKIQPSTTLDHYSSNYSTYLSSSKPSGSAFSDVSLPVQKMKEQIISALSHTQVLIIQGETGSGKTTVIPQLILDHFNASIVCTQPRRIAATSIAEHVASQRKCKIGEEVGYAVRFDNKTTEETLIRYVTEGILLKELLNDPLLKKYDFIMIDEAHERTLNTDLLLGAIKHILNSNKRPDLTVIVSSATLDVSKFSLYFNKAPILKIPGSLHKTVLNYQKIVPNSFSDWLEEIYKKIISLHLSKEEGDILVFLPGSEEIEALCQLCYNKLKSEDKPLILIPLYSLLEPAKQKLAFCRFKARKCVLSTNIAETSLTVPGIKFVIDSGLCKVLKFIPSLGISILEVNEISKQSAVQRSGRAGRIEDGVCFRMFDEGIYNNFKESEIPELLRSNLSSVLLKLFEMDKSPFKFGFVDKPDENLILEALYRLYTIGGIDKGGNITKEGELMNELPLDPCMSRMIIFSRKFNLVEETLSICSMLNVNNFIFKSKLEDEETEANFDRFKCLVSDHITYYNIFEGFCKSQDKSKFCEEIRVNKKALDKAYDIFKQLKEICAKLKILNKNFSQYNNYNKEFLLRKIVCAGYFHNAAVAKKVGSFENLRSFVEGRLHRSSMLNGIEYKIEYLVYNEIISGKYEYMNVATVVDPVWLKEVAGEFFSYYNN